MHAFPSSFACSSGEDVVKENLTHEATSKALTITVKKLSILRAEMVTLQDRVKAAEEQAAAAALSATAAEQALATSTTEATASLQQIEQLPKQKSRL